MSEAVLQTFELTKVFHHPLFTWLVRARALTDLSMTVTRGEVFGLLGPNGSGKSTTIKLILGLLFPTRGQVAVFGRRPEDLSVKARLGFLPEESHLYRYLDAEETLDFYGRLFGLPGAERRRRIGMLLELVGLQKERRRPVGEYSKGMQRRIGLAQCLLNDPELVILDEPTSGLDPLGTREVKDLILQLKAKGKTVLLSSHLLADVEDVCDRVAILYGGRQLAQGSIEELLRDDSQVQVTAPMDGETVEAMRELLRRRLGNDVPVRVSPPQERLENFFLRIIRDAGERRLETSGASAPVMEEGRSAAGSLLDRLAKGEAPAAAAAPAARVENDRSVLDALVEAKDGPPASAPAAAAPKEGVDTAAIEKLCKGE